MSRINTVVSAGLLAGLFDITDAFIFFGARGTKIMTIGQSIASGLIGKAAYDGGWTTFAMGMGLHFAIAVCMALVFYLLTMIIPVIKQMIVVSGMVYGLACWAVMNYVVLPASRGDMHPHFPPVMGPVFYNAIFAHVILVGLTIALVTRSALKGK